MLLKDSSMTELEHYEMLIEGIVKVHGCIKNVDLVLTVMADTNISKFSNETYVKAIENLDQRKVIVGVVYTPPNNYSGVLYFPFGTKFDFHS